MLPEERFYRELLERVERKFLTAASPAPPARGRGSTSTSKRRWNTSLFFRASLSPRAGIEHRGIDSIFDLTT